MCGNNARNNTIISSVSTPNNGEISGPGVDPRRPRWKDVYDGYPLTNEGTSYEDDLGAEEVITYLFGTYNNENACAARLSIALLISGVGIGGDNTVIITEKIYGKDVTKTETIDYKKITHSGDSLEGKNVILGAEKMRCWLWKKWVKANRIVYNPKSLTDAQREFNGENGVYIMRPKVPKIFEATGHCTLWTGENVIGGSKDKHYINENTFAVYLWILK